MFTDCENDHATLFMKNVKIATSYANYLVAEYLSQNVDGSYHPYEPDELY